jgi:hypothetical protein
VIVILKHKNKTEIYKTYKRKNLNINTNTFNTKFLSQAVKT